MRAILTSSTPKYCCVVPAPPAPSIQHVIPDWLALLSVLAHSSAQLLCLLLALQAIGLWFGHFWALPSAPGFGAAVVCLGLCWIIIIPRWVHKKKNTKETILFRKALINYVPNSNFYLKTVWNEQVHSYQQKALYLEILQLCSQQTRCNYCLHTLRCSEEERPKTQQRLIWRFQLKCNKGWL